MHRNFADWYRQIHPEAPSELLKVKWKVIDSARRKKDSYAAVPDLIRLAFGRPVLSGGAGMAFVEAIRKTEPTIPIDQRPREVPVLASAAVVVWLEASDDRVADQTALMVLTTHCQGHGPEPAFVDVLHTARNHLVRRQKARGVPSDAPIVQVPKPEVVPSAVVRNDAANQTYLMGNATTVTQVLGSVRTVSDSATGVAQSVSDAMQVLWTEICRLREESNILWWLFGELSRDLHQPVTDLARGGAALLIGKELADLVDGIPGPLAAPAFLDRMLRLVDGQHEPLSLAAALGPAPPAAIAALTERIPERYADLLPVHAAASAFKALEGDDGWQKLVRNRIGMDVTSEFSLLALAEQVYRERLLWASLQKHPI